MSRHESDIRLRHMLEYAREAVSLARGKSRADLDADRLLNLSLVHLVSMVGEAANRVPSEAQEEHPEIAWPAIVGMRNRLIHLHVRGLECVLPSAPSAIPCPGIFRAGERSFAVGGISCMPLSKVARIISTPS
jgi:uncharacterized protein with HEPN domain